MKRFYWSCFAIVNLAHCANAHGVISAPIWRQSVERVGKAGANWKRTVSETLINAVEIGAYFANSIFDPFHLC
jgi:hypothetical protein